MTFATVKYLSFSSPYNPGAYRADIYECEELQEQPTIHCWGAVDPQPFHVEVVFKVIKAVLHNILITVCRQSLFGALDFVGHYAKESTVPFAVLLDLLIVKIYPQPAVLAFPEQSGNAAGWH